MPCQRFSGAVLDWSDGVAGGETFAQRLSHEMGQIDLLTFWEPLAEGDLSLIEFLRVGVGVRGLLLGPGDEGCSFEPRGPMEVKGEGLMTPYLIVGPKPASVSPAAAPVISAAG